MKYLIILMVLFLIIPDIYSQEWGVNDRVAIFGMDVNRIPPNPKIFQAINSRDGALFVSASCMPTTKYSSANHWNFNVLCAVHYPTTRYATRIYHSGCPAPRNPRIRSNRWCAIMAVYEVSEHGVFDYESADNYADWRHRVRHEICRLR